MITREDIRELAQFRLENGANCAISFYFQPETPSNKAHREQTIYAKDLVRDAMREVNSHGHDSCARADLERVLLIAERLQTESPRAKAVFACGKASLWREFDVPADLPKSMLYVNRRFHLKPFARLLDAQPRLGVAL